MKLRNKKTGQVVEAYKGEPIDLFLYLGTDEEGDEVYRKTYRSLAELNEEWEDVPSEPLIKDEKIRKAVRAWAEAQGLTEVYLASNGYEIYGGVDDWVMQFEGEPFPFADKNRLYTITELCGEPVERDFEETRPTGGEEIKQAEPLIETADARYITKLWASTNLIPSNSNEIEVCLIDSPKGTITQFYSDGLYIQFFGRVAPDAISGRCYTIDELCGEEEE